MALLTSPLGESGGKQNTAGLLIDHKWPVNLLLADTVSISDGGIADFEAISQCNELESGRMGERLTA